MLTVKHPSLIAEAERLFAGTGITISCQGQKHLGAVIGSDAFQTQYISSKVVKWVHDVEELSKIAAEEPQVALSAFTKGIRHR